MDRVFWHQRWQQNQIGFHEGQVNRHLENYWPGLSPLGDETVMVPLCGKSVDLAWLASRGHRVVGVELSELACRAFFAEHDIAAEVDKLGAFTRFVGGNIELLCGDFFDLRADMLAELSLFYDRAAMIALPPDMRPRYCAHLASLMPNDARGLLISLDYPAQAFAGPPFAVSEAEIHDQLGQFFAIETLHQGPLRPTEGLRKRGLNGSSEQVFMLRKQAQHTLLRRHL